MSPALDDVKVLNTAGKAIGFIALPERAANVCFGGHYRNRLFMAATTGSSSLYVVNAQAWPAVRHLTCGTSSDRFR